MTTPAFSARKTFLYATITFLLTLLLLGAAGEFILRQQRIAIEGSDRLAKGLFVYDQELGWRMQPDWSGRHSHNDFAVSYQTGPDGFRGRFRDRAGAVTRRVAMVGDSFTFGFGVDAGETFTDLLDRGSNDSGGQGAGGETAYLNFGVPGYATDQEVLLIERVMPRYRPDVVLLVVYLGNDLADNMRLFPLQLAAGKPYFELTQGRLSLRNVPVPKQPKPAEERGVNLGQVILAGSGLRPGFWQSVLSNSETLRRMGLDFSPKVDLRQFFARRQKPALALFQALAARAREAVARQGGAFGLVLLAGRSFAQKPDSISAQYQDYLRGAIVDWAGTVNIPVFDAASELRRRFQAGKVLDYYPNEGHLTPLGHAAVAKSLAPWIAERFGAADNKK